VYVPFCGHAIIEAMSGVKTEVKDCMLTDVNQWGYHELQVHQVGREGGRGGREGRRKERREGRKEGGKKGGREERREGRKEGGKKGGREAYSLHFSLYHRTPSSRSARCSLRTCKSGWPRQNECVTNRKAGVN